MCVFPLPVFSETFLILTRIQRDIAKMYTRLHVKYSLLMADFNEYWILSTYFRKSQMANIMKIRPLEAE